MTASTWKKVAGVPVSWSAAELGITEYMATAGRALNLRRALIKTSPHDFIVQEIGLPNRIACLSGSGRDAGGLAVGAENAGNSGRPDLHAGYFRFVLRKVDLTTPGALELLSRKLGVRSDTFRYAGLKDRRGVTAQWISADSTRVSAEDVARAATSLAPSVAVGSFERMPEGSKHISTGGLLGNRFTVLVRNVPPGTPVEPFLKVASTGFFNYFGTQRFGSRTDLPTHGLGRAVYAQQWSELLASLLRPSPEDDPATRKAKEYAWYPSGDGDPFVDMRAATRVGRRLLTESNPFKVRTRLPRGNVQDRRLLQAMHSVLGKQLRDSRGIRVEDVPEEARKEIIHLAVGRETLRLYAAAYQASLWNRTVSALVTESRNSASVSTTSGAAATMLPSVPLLCQSSVTSPSPYGEIYRRLTQPDGVSVESVALTEEQLGMGGGDRDVIQYPTDVTAAMVPWAVDVLPEELNDELALSECPIDPRDLQELARAKLPCLLLSFTLPSGSYATVCLREMARYDFREHQQRLCMQNM